MVFDWNGRRVFLTGGSGFVGSWVAETLLERGAIVSALVRKDSPRMDVLKRIGKNHPKAFKKVFGDLNVKDPREISRKIKDSEIIFDIGAITQVPYSIRHPAETMRTNVNGVLGMLEGIRLSNQDAVMIYTSTDKVYGEPDRLPITEKNQLSAKCPYDASKVAADRLVYTYHKTYGIKATMSRCSNIYGGRDANILRAIPDFVTSLIDGKRPVIRGHGNHERDFMYVTDAVAGIILLAENIGKTNGEAFNFGTGKPTKVRELAETVCRLYPDNKLVPEILGKLSPGEIDVQYIDAGKARKLLGWKPEVKLNEGLGRTISWYRNNDSWFREVIRKTSRFYGV